MKPSCLFRSLLNSVFQWLCLGLPRTLSLQAGDSKSSRQDPEAITHMCSTRGCESLGDLTIVLPGPQQTALDSENLTLASACVAVRQGNSDSRPHSAFLLRAPSSPQVGNPASVESVSAERHVAVEPVREDEWPHETVGTEWRRGDARAGWCPQLAIPSQNHSNARPCLSGVLVAP